MAFRRGPFFFDLVFEPREKKFPFFLLGEVLGVGGKFFPFLLTLLKEN